MAQMGRIGGPLLADNLLRNGNDLAFDTTLVYLKVGSNSLGINNSGPGNALDVGNLGNIGQATPGTFRTNLLLGTTQTEVGTIYITTNQIQNVSGSITFQPNQSSNPTIIVPQLSTANLLFNGNTISDTVTNDSINFSPNGTGAINFANGNGNVTVNVTGDLHSQGNITLDGNITLGNQTTDTITVTAEVNSNVLPIANNTYDLGSTSLKWATAYSQNFYPTTITTGGITTGSITASGTNGLNNNVTIGTTSSNTLGVAAVINTSLIPSATNADNLGNNSYYWNNLYATTVTDGTITFNSNVVSIPSSTNTNLQLGGTGTGKVIFSSLNLPNTNNVTVGGTLGVTGTTTFSNNVTSGAITQTGSYNLTGNARLGNITSVGNITAANPLVLPTVTINGSVITGTASGSNLKLTANTGQVVEITGATKFDKNLRISSPPAFSNNGLLVPTSEYAYSPTAIAYSSTLNLYVAIGDRYSPQIKPYFSISTDGINWTISAPVDPTLVSDFYPTAIAVNSSGKFVAVGYSNSTYYPQFSTSTNGTTWTTPANINGSTTPTYIFGLTVNSSGLFIAVGMWYSPNTPVYATSTDGTTWTTPAKIGTGNTSYEFTAITVNNNTGRFVAVGFRGSGSVYATSTNGGSTWTNPTAITSASYTLYGIVVNSSGLFVAVGYDINGYLFSITSSNGTTWGSPNVINSGIPYVNLSISVSNGVFLLTAQDDTGQTPGIYATSTDGTTWNITTLPNGNGSGITATTGNANKFFVGWGVDGTGIISTWALDTSVIVPNLTVSSPSTFLNGVTLGSITQVGNFTQLSATSTVDTLLAQVGKLFIGIDDESIFYINPAKPFYQDINTFSVTGNLSANTLTVNGADFTSSLLDFSGSTITNTALNGNVTFTANGTGSVLVENLSLYNNTILNNYPTPTTDAQKSIFLTPAGTGNVVINSTTSAVLPVGNNSNRTLTSNGQVRFNSTNLNIEGYSNTGYVDFINVYSQDQKTYITPELTPGAADNTLRFGINNTVTTTITSSSLTNNTMYAGNISISGNTINELNNSNTLSIVPSGIGQINLNSTGIQGNNIYLPSSGAMVISSTGLGGHTTFGGTYGVVIPSGSSSNYPAAPQTGTTRFNTTSKQLEVYTGTAWVPAYGTSSAISSSQVSDLNLIYTLLLGF